jgi:phytoene synthase
LKISPPKGVNFPDVDKISVMKEAMKHFDPEILRLARSRRGPYLAALIAPRGSHAGLLAVLALDGELARIVRSVSEPMLGRIRLQWWVDVMPGVVGGRPPSHPVAQALAPQGLDLALLRGLVEAYNFDLDDGTADVAQHIERARLRGGVFADLLLSVLGVADAPIRQAAHDVVSAWIIAEALTEGLRIGSNEDAQALRDQALRWVAEARTRAMSTDARKPQRRAALPVLLLAQPVERRLKDVHDPLGAAAVLGMWWGSIVGRF